MNWTAVCVSFLLSTGLTWVLLRPRFALRFLDHANERSLHIDAVPRSGGIAINVAIATGGYLLATSSSEVGPLIWFAFGAGLIAAVSLVDDLSHLPATVRLLVQFAVAIGLVWSGLVVPGLDLPGVRVVGESMLRAGFCVVLIVWLINLYNFMDGMDGFAGGMAFIGFSILGWFGWLAGNSLYSGFCMLIVAANAGFLLFNFPPARIFMGDVGASVLGLLVAVMAIWGDRDGIVSLWLVLIIFSPFVIDATMTLLRRVWHRERFWEAHRSHYYQRLVQLGWGHRRTVFGEYALMLVCGGLALWSHSEPPARQWLAVCLWFVGYVMLANYVTRMERKANG